MRALQHTRTNSGKGRIGIFALNIQLARGVYLALKEASLKIPHDIAVVGFDDTGADYFDPPLTTVRQNLGGIGRQSVQLLLREMAECAEHTNSETTDAKEWQPEVRRLAPELVVRNSSDLASGYCLRTNPTVNSLALAGVN
jgi:DNA-binding LacI/PurR family transcriptional regulator